MARTSSFAGGSRWLKRSCDACKKRLPSSRPSSGLSTAARCEHSLPLATSTTGYERRRTERARTGRRSPARPRQHAGTRTARGSPRAAFRCVSRCWPGGTQGDVPEPAVVDLLGGPLGIGGVVPLLLDAHACLVEAGTFGEPFRRGGCVNPGAALPASEHSFRRDVAGTASPVVAGSRRKLDGFSPGIDQADAGLVAEVLEHVRAKGLRMVYEPSWRVPAPEGFSPLPAPAGPRRWAQRDEATPTRVLVVTGTVPGTLVSPEGLVEIVEALAQSPVHGCHAGLRGRVRGWSLGRLLPASGRRGCDRPGGLAAVVRRPPVPLFACPAKRRRPDDPVVVAGARHPAASPLHPVQRTPSVPAQPGPGRGDLACTGH